MKGCKDCPVYEKCEVTYRSSACEALRASYEVHSDPEVVTNADKIRSMTDEELARVMDMVCPPDTACNDGQQCIKCWIEWLKQPVEEE